MGGDCPFPEVCSCSFNPHAVHMYTCTQRWLHKYEAIPTANPLYLYSAFNKITPSHTSVSGSGFFQGPCSKSASQPPIQANQTLLECQFSSLNIRASLCTCGILATKDAENLEIAKSMWVGDQKQKYDLEWSKWKHGCNGGR